MFSYLRLTLLQLLLLGSPLFFHGHTLAEGPVACEGRCSDTGEACLSWSSCSYGSCEFSPSCLPSEHEPLLPLIRRATLDSKPPSLSSWVCGDLECQVEGDSLFFRSSWGAFSYASKSLPLAPSRYLISAKLLLEKGGWARFSVDTREHEVFSEPFSYKGPETWQEASIYVELPPELSRPSEWRLYAEGPGGLRLKDFQILELEPLGPYIRVTSDTETQLHLRIKQILVPEGEGKRLMPCNGPHCQLFPLEGNAEWYDLSQWAARFQEAFPSYDALFEGYQALGVWMEGQKCLESHCEALLAPVPLSIELAFAPSESALVDQVILELSPSGSVISLPYPSLYSSPLQYRLSTPLLDISKDLATAVPAKESPKEFHLAFFDSLIEGSRSLPLEEALFQLYKTLGLNSIDEASTRVSDKSLPELGFQSKSIHVPSLLHGFEGPFSKEALKAHLEATPFFREEALEKTFRDCSKDKCLLILEEAPFVPDDESLIARFQAFLKDAGENQKSFGLETFEDAMPLLFWPASSASSAFPESPSSRLRTRQLEFALEDYKDRLEVLVGLLQEKTEAPMALMPHKALHPAFQSQLSLKLGLSGLLSRSLSGPNDDCRHSHIQAHAAFIGALGQNIKELSETRNMPYVQGLLNGFGRASLTHILLTYAAYGSQWFLLDSYGPGALSLLPSLAHFEDARQEILKRVAKASEYLSKAEPWLLNAKPNASSTVIMISESAAYVGSDDALDPEAIGWFTAFKQAHLPIAFMLESDIERGVLSLAHAKERVLILTSPFLSDAAFSAIQRFTKDGGTLVLAPHAGTYNRYGELAQDRPGWLGSLSYSEVQNESTTLSWSGKAGISSLLIPPPWYVLQAITGRVKAKSEDKSLALSFQQGHGKVLALGVPLGTLFLQHEKRCDPMRPLELPHYNAHYSGVLRAMLTEFSEQVPLAESDEARYSLTAFQGPNGTPFNYLLPWVSVEESASLKFPLASHCSSIHDALEGKSLPLTFGNLQGSYLHPAILTWPDPSCFASPMPEPEVPEDEEAKPQPKSHGCDATGLESPLFLLLALLSLRKRAPN